MEKTYEQWTPEKANINNHGKRPNKYHEGGIYWAYLGENIGFEQDGQGKMYSRPVLIVRGFSKGLVLCVPISHTIKTNSLYHPISHGKVKGSLILSQVRSIDTLRLSTPITTIPRDMLKSVKRSLARMIIK